MITDGHLYELGKLPGIDLAALENTFGNLPPDPYAEKRLRSRRYSRYACRNGALERLSHKDFMQGKDINKYVGDVQRNYEEIEDTVTKNPAFLSMFGEFRARAGLTEDAVIEAHQIRWHCGEKVVEAPAPEGMHQDGFDYIGMFMVDANVGGGEILLWKSPDDAPCFKKKLESGEFVIVNDKKMFHNAAPLVPAADRKDGHWDIIVLTANKAQGS